MISATRGQTSSPLTRVSATRDHPKWQGYTIKHKIEVRFAYTSPADGATHASSLQMSAFPNGRPLHAGDALQVLASKTKADKKTRQV
jgi:hypothetical protein